MPADAAPESRIRRAVPASSVVCAKRSEGAHDCHFIFRIHAGAKRSPSRQAATIAARPRAVKQDFETARSNPTAAVGFYSGLEMRKCNVESHASFVPAKTSTARIKRNVLASISQTQTARRFHRLHATQNRFSRFDANDCHPSLHGDAGRTRRRLPQSVMNTSHGLPGRINYKDCLHDRDDFHQTAWGDLDSVSETHGNQALPDLFFEQRPSTRSNATPRQIQQTGTRHQ
jgi:hypothetical protein